MSNRFFFLTSYDSVSGTILSSILNTHPDISCKASYPDPFLAISITQEMDDRVAPIDQFIELNYCHEKKFSGNTQRYSALELQHKTLTEKTKQAYNAANVVLSPALRIQFLLQSWRSTSLTDEHTINYIEENLKYLHTQNHNLIILYHFNYFHNLILDEIISTEIPLSIPNRLFAIALARVLAQDSADLPVPRKKFSFEKLLESKEEMIKLLNFITNDKIVITPEFINKLELELKNKNEHIDQLPLCKFEEWQTKLINKFIHKKLKTIYYPHLDLPLSNLYKNVGYNFEPSQEDTVQYSKLISIQLNSNRPAQLTAYFDNIEETADNPSDIEVLVNIDIGDHAMQSLLDNEILARKFTLKYIQTERPPSFCDLWKPINKLLEITDPNSYFLVNISDEMLFITPGWDTILKKYIGFFPDHLFRLRASRNKFRNYFDPWEASFAQDAIPITTKKWIDVGGDWNPCFGPDSFQQLVAYYLAREGKFSNSQYLREAPLTEIKFAGDVPAMGIAPEKAWRHHNDHIKAMLICQSPPMQLEARRRAMLIKANIIAEVLQLNDFYIVDNPRKKTLYLHEKYSDAVIDKMNYKVNHRAIFFTNQWRKLAFFSYFGDGRINRKNIIKSFLQYLKARYLLVYKMEKRVRYHGRRLLNLIKTLLIVKNYRLRNILIIHKKINNPNHSLLDENSRLRQLYKIVCIENQKLHDEKL